MKMIDKMKRFALSLPGGDRVPREYIQKYNINSGLKEYPGGRAWIMWFLDKFEKEYEKM